MDDLMDCLSMPYSVREKIKQHSKDEEQQRHECIHYYLKSSPFALWGWGYLGGELYHWGKEDVLTAAKAYIQRAPGTHTCGWGMFMYWNVEDTCDCLYSQFIPAVRYIVYNTSIFNVTIMG